MAALRNWRIETESADEVCRLTLDIPGRGQNVLSAEVMTELGAALDDIERAAPSALLVCSGKARGFIAGADIDEFSQFNAAENKPQVAAYLAAAHQVIDRLEALPMPSVALLNGHCLGGGLELALACDYRVASDAPANRIGLPEVRLGIHPGFGGVARLIDAIGALAAMDLMLSGRSVSPRTAKRLGIVDEAVPLRQLERTARYLIGARRRPRRWGWRKLLNHAPLRYGVAAVMHKKLADKVDPAHYPAPYRLLELWRRHGGKRSALLAAEQSSVAELMSTPTSRNLVRVFFLREGLKKTGDGEHKRERRFEHAHIIGAGVMGGDIAAWCALRGVHSTLHDRDPQALAAAKRRAFALFKRKLKSPRLTQRALDRFQIDLAGDGARRADVVIEAIVENADAKRALFAEVEAVARADALLATNTSSIPLDTLSAAVRAPQRLVGLHFFNPVAKMQLLEVVCAEATAPEIAGAAAAFAARIGRLPVTVKSAPGFLVNRILMPYLLESVELLGEGIAPDAIDRAATRFGMLMGPITLADTVGLDICLRVSQNLSAEPPALLREKVDAGHLGKKSGRGFYRWKDGKPGGGKGDSAPAEIEDRLVFRYLNETLACLHEGVVSHAEPKDAIDAALVFGAGFAPFRGGPIHYAGEQGRDNLLWKMRLLQEQHGERFKPCAGWEMIAN